MIVTVQKAQDAYIKWEVFYLELLKLILSSSSLRKNPSSLQFCTFLILRVGVEQNSIKTSRNIFIFFKQALTVAPHGLNECYLTAVLK